VLAAVICVATVAQADVADVAEVCATGSGAMPGVKGNPESLIVPETVCDAASDASQARFASFEEQKSKPSLTNLKLTTESKAEPSEDLDNDSDPSFHSSIDSGLDLGLESDMVPENNLENSKEASNNVHSKVGDDQDVETIAETPREKKREPLRVLSPDEFKKKLLGNQTANLSANAAEEAELHLGQSQNGQNSEQHQQATSHHEPEKNTESSLSKDVIKDEESSQEAEKDASEAEVEILETSSSDVVKDEVTGIGLVGLENRETEYFASEDVRTHEGDTDAEVEKEATGDDVSVEQERLVPSAIETTSDDSVMKSHQDSAQRTVAEGKLTELQNTASSATAPSSNSETAAPTNIVAKASAKPDEIVKSSPAQEPPSRSFTGNMGTEMELARRRRQIEDALAQAKEEKAVEEAILQAIEDEKFSSSGKLLSEDVSEASSEGVVDSNMQHEVDDSDHQEESNLFNYASLDAGAIILGSNKGMKGSSSLLVDDRDKYALSPCEESKWVTIGLSEEIEPDGIEISNWERYSSTLRNFEVWGASKYPQSDWILLGEYEAAPTRIGVQTFTIQNKAWVRYLKFRFLTHYDDEFYCTLTEIRVFGSTDKFEKIHNDLDRKSKEIRALKESIDNAFVHVPGGSGVASENGFVVGEAHHFGNDEPPSMIGSNSNDHAGSDGIGLANDSTGVSVSGTDEFISSNDANAGDNTGVLQEATSAPSSTNQDVIEINTSPEETSASGSTLDNTVDDLDKNTGGMQVDNVATSQVATKTSKSPRFPNGIHLSATQPLEPVSVPPTDSEVQTTHAPQQPPIQPAVLNLRVVSDDENCAPGEVEVSSLDDGAAAATGMCAVYALDTNMVNDNLMDAIVEVLILNGKHTGSEVDVWTSCPEPFDEIGILDSATDKKKIKDEKEQEQEQEQEINETPVILCVYRSPLSPDSKRLGYLSLRSHTNTSTGQCAFIPRLGYAICAGPYMETYAPLVVELEQALEAGHVQLDVPNSQQNADIPLDLKTAEADADIIAAPATGVTKEVSDSGQHSSVGTPPTSGTKVPTQNPSSLPASNSNTGNTGSTSSSQAATGSSGGAGGALSSNNSSSSPGTINENDSTHVRSSSHGSASSNARSRSSGHATTSLESVFKSLTDKIMDLEIDQSLFKKYLEEINSKYASAIRELQQDLEVSDRTHGEFHEKIRDLNAILARIDGEASVARQASGVQQEEVRRLQDDLHDLRSHAFALESTLEDVILGSFLVISVLGITLIAVCLRLYCFSHNTVVYQYMN